MTTTCVRTCDKRPPPTPHLHVHASPSFSPSPTPFTVFRVAHKHPSPPGSHTPSARRTHSVEVCLLSHGPHTRKHTHTHTHTHARVHVLRFIILIMSGLATTAAHQPPSGFAQSARATHQPNGVLTQQLQHVTPCRAPSTRHVQYVTPGCRSLNT